MGKGYRGVASIFRVVRTNRSLCERRRLEPLGGSGGMLPQEIFKFRGSEMPFLAFSRGHMFSILQDLRVHVAQWFKSANLMIKKRLLPIKIFFLDFKCTPVRTCVRAYMVATPLGYVQIVFHTGC